MAILLQLIVLALFVIWTWSMSTETYYCVFAAFVVYALILAYASKTTTSGEVVDNFWGRLARNLLTY